MPRARRYICNFFPDIRDEDWKGQESHPSASNSVSLILACYLIKSDGHTIAVFIWCLHGQHVTLDKCGCGIG